MPNKVLKFCSMWIPLILFCSPCKRAYCIVFAMKGNRQRAKWFKMGPFWLQCYLHNRKHTFLDPVTSLWHEDANNLMIFSYILVVSFYFPNKVLTVCSMWTPLTLFYSPCEGAYCFVFAMKGNCQRSDWFKMGPFWLNCYLHKA